MLSTLVICALLAAYAHCYDRESRVVRTSQGSVRGYMEDDVYVFYGIPYATAPTGVDKFKAPLPGPVWLETLDAVDTDIVCPQSLLFAMGMQKNLQENCLIANVYVPDTDETNLPVVVYVHGGAYHVGFGSLAVPKHLVRSKKIIAVTFNYRLGAHGFLCLGTSDIPGNAGMKDQVALLRWVKQNIASYGGNPDDVTIDGFSAGSSAVDLLQLSKTATGLFHKVVPESGANVAVWSVQLDPLENAKAFAKELNFTDVDDVYALEQFYKTLPIETLNSETFLSRKDSNFVFSPCVESDIGQERFLEDTPFNILKRGDYNKVPMLYGFAKMEGLFRVGHFGFFPQWKEDMNTKFSDFLPADLQFESEEQKEQVAEKVKKFYFGDKPVSEETVFAYIDYFTDVIFAYPTLRSVTLQVEAGNDRIYLYEFSFTGDEAVSALESVDVRGADHCAQTSALLDGAGMSLIDETSLSEGTKKMKAVTRELWLNFITKGTPVPSGSAFPVWPPVGAGRGPHMSLDRTLELRGPLLEQRARFWDDIYERHYRAPVPPPTHPPRRHSEL